MAGTTTTYGFPYPELGDPPNGPDAVQDLAQAVEDKIELVDAAVTAITGLTHAFASSSTDETGFSNTTFAAGAAPVGVAFTAPPSGVVIVHFSVYMTQNINTQVTIASFEMKTGVTVGSGTLVGAAANSDRAIVVGRAVNAGAVAMAQSGNWTLYTGLTPGASYNVRMMHCVDGGSGTILYRQILVQPMV